MDIDTHSVLKRQAGACTMFGLLIIVIVGAFYIQHRQREWVLRNEQAQRLLNSASELLSREVSRVRSDALYLAHRDDVRAFVAGDTSARESLIADCKLFVQEKESYDQLRLLDLAGHEIIRVNFTGANATSVAPDGLQDKSDRYYYHAAKSLRRGEIFVSEFDLNVEHGAIERPLKPVIRFVTPVADPQGEVRGYLVLNYLGAALLDELADPTVPGDTLLVRHDGQYIRSHDEQDAWGWLLHHDRSFATQYPREWQSIQPSRFQCMLTPAGAFAFQTIALSRVADTQIAANGSSRSQPALGENAIVAVSMLPRHSVFAASNQLLQRLLIFSAGIFALTIVFTRAWARATCAREQQSLRIAASEERLRELSSRLLRIQEEERRAISREIHDELGQQATAINLDLKLAERNLTNPNAAEHLARAIADNETLLRTLHEFAVRVRPAVLDDLGLTDAIQSHIDEFQRRTQLVVDSDIQLSRTIEDEVADNAFRLVQESLNNVAKHADATQVRIQLIAAAEEPDQLLISVEDDGRGTAGSGDGSGLGLIGMQERVDLLGGELEIRSDPQRGTRIWICLPLSRRETGEVACP